MKLKLYAIYEDRKGNQWQAILNLHFGNWMLKRLDKAITMETNNRSAEGFLTYVRTAEEHEKVNM